MMTVYELYRKMLEKISGRYDASEADSITSLIFESMCGMSRNSIIREPGKEMAKSTESILMSATDRILAGEPVQYITGEAWFCGHKFSVRPGALIPRPETEELVQHLIRSATDDRPTILDIGTGSGCIAISLKKVFPEASVTAIDISDAALAIAMENAAAMGADINFLKIDFLKESERSRLGEFDRIISNPPYIPFFERTSLDEHVRDHEPEIALFVPDNNPLIFYEAIAGFAGSHLRDKGIVFLEIHEPYADDICTLFMQKGFSPECLTDMFGKKRMIRAIQNR